VASSAAADHSYRHPPPLFEIYCRGEAALGQYTLDSKIRSGDRQAPFDLALSNLPFGFGLTGEVEQNAVAPRAEFAGLSSVKLEQIPLRRNRLSG
jgi:hypothetical protein